MQLFKVNFYLNQISTTLRRKRKNVLHKEEKSKQTESCKDYKITKTNKIRLKIGRNHLFNYKRKKNNSDE